MRFRPLPAIAGLLATTLLCWTQIGSAGAKKPGPAIDQARIQRAMDNITEARLVPGLSLAVFNSKGLLWSATSGVKDYATRAKVGPRTTFEAASLSKTVFAYIAVQELARAHADLDTPLPPLAFTGTSPDRARFATLTPRQLLTHSSGLPNWRGQPNLGATTLPDFVQASQPLTFVSEAGKFHYSGEGFVYLQEQIERLTGRGLNDLATKDVFSPLEMPNSSFLFTDNVSSDVATSYSRKGDAAEKYRPATAVSAASLHTTASDYARFLTALIRQGRVAGAQISRATVIAEQTSSFEVKWALGFGEMRADAHTYWFNWGDNDTFKGYFLYSVDDDIGYVYFANGAAGIAIRNRIDRAVLGRPDIPVWPTSYTQEPDR